MTARSAHKRLDAGFTLVEMLVVLAVLALVTAVSLPLLGRPSETLRLQGVASELVSALRATRAAAILRNGEMVLTIDLDRRTFSSPIVQARALGADVSTKMNFAMAEREDALSGSFRFFPDGSSTGGDVTLSLGGHNVKVCIDWLTGEARRDPC